MKYTRVVLILVLISLINFMSGCEGKLSAEALNIKEKAEDPYTEFYILGPEGRAENYPTEYELGEKGTVIVGVANHEHRSVNYAIKVRVENTFLPENQQQFTLAHNETWENAVTFVPPVKGNNMKLEFLLFKETDRNKPYRDLHLWINVSENVSETK